MALVTAGVVLTTLMMPAARGEAVTEAVPNPVTYWSEIIEGVVSAGRTPASAEVNTAIAHLAMYDALQLIEGGAPVVAKKVGMRASATEAAAVASAAHGVLVARVPAKAAEVGERYARFLDLLPEGRPTLDGIIIGTAAADALVASRSGDGLNNVVPYVQPATGPGAFEPVAPTTPVDTVMTQVKPLVLGSSGQLRPAGPPPLDSTAYAADLNEVKALGSLGSTARTAWQSETARFHTEHTMVHFSRTLRELADTRGLSTREAARMLAMAHVSSADAITACFEAKYHYTFWRPVHAIRHADIDGNPLTEADPAWTPYVSVPNHPEYPSGHSCWVGSVARALNHYFGTDEVALDMSSKVTGTTHHYSTLSQWQAEVQDARIWAGAHFRSATVDGATLGAEVADYVIAQAFYQ